MTVKVYLYRGGIKSSFDNGVSARAYEAAFAEAISKWGERVKFHQGAMWNVVLELWMEFDTHEEAVMFKLTEL